MRDNDRILKTGELEEMDQCFHMKLKRNRTWISHLVATPMTDPVQSIYFMSALG